jgi:hypothetical protein
MIKKEEFNKRRNPDVYTRRNGKLEKLNEKKPCGELIERMDGVINRLDKIIKGMEDFTSGTHTDISFDIDDFMLSEEMKKRIKRVDEEQSADDTNDSVLDRDSIAGSWEIMNESDIACILNLKPKTDTQEETATPNKNMEDAFDALSDIFLNTHNESAEPDNSLGTLDLYETMKRFFNKIYGTDMTQEKEKKTIFCILGETGSGKDSLVEYTLKNFNLDLKPVVSYTDRPIRPGEQQGKEHIFLSKDKMTAFLDSYKKDIAAYTQIGENGYRYCATTTTIDKSDIYIIDPNGLKEFKERTDDRYNLVAIYIDCPLKERKKRTQKRGDEIIKFESRVAAESEQFSKFREEHGYDYIIDNGPISTMHKNSMVLLDIFRHYKKDIFKK